MSENNASWMTALIWMIFLAFGILCLAWPGVLRSATIRMYRSAPGRKWSEPFIRYAESSSSEVVVRLVGAAALVAAVLLAVLFVLRV